MNAIHGCCAGARSQVQSLYRLSANRKATPNRDFPTRLLALWLLLTSVGVFSLSMYEFKGNTPAASVIRWPTEATLERDPERPTLVFFYHPRCPCTAASIAELDRLLSRFAGKFRCYSVVTVPPGMGSAWEAGRNQTAALRLPGALQVRDTDGVLARHFGVDCSGTILAFSPDGQRLFAGGLTASRGHEGESTGILALRAMASGNIPRHTDSPVFGCPLLGKITESDREATL